jgi:hypothetical protein
MYTLKKGWQNARAKNPKEGIFPNVKNPFFDRVEISVSLKFVKLPFDAVNIKLPICAQNSSRGIPYLWATNRLACSANSG